MAKEHTVPYENNPFYIGLNGLKVIFANAQSVAIFAVILSVAYFVFSSALNVVDSINSATMSEAEIKMRDTEQSNAITEFFSQEPEKLAIYGIIGASAVFLVIVLTLWLHGALEYTSARLARGERVELKTALGETGKELASYVWLNILITIKLFLWTLLLIVPGIIMTIRYSLAGTVFFAEGKHGNAAIKRSSEITKGAWFTTFASGQLWNIITFGAISLLLQPGTNAILYSQLSRTTDAGHTKPGAHWLSWLTFLIPILLFLLIVVPLIILILIFANSFGP